MLLAAHRNRSVHLGNFACFAFDGVAEHQRCDAVFTRERGGGEQREARRDDDLAGGALQTHVAGLQGFVGGVVERSRVGVAFMHLQQTPMALTACVMQQARSSRRIR